MKETAAAKRTCVDGAARMCLHLAEMIQRAGSGPLENVTWTGAAATKTTRALRPASRARRVTTGSGATTEAVSAGTKAGIEQTFTVAALAARRRATAIATLIATDVAPAQSAWVGHDRAAQIASPRATRCGAATTLRTGIAAARTVADGEMRFAAGGDLRGGYRDRRGEDAGPSGRGRYDGHRGRYARDERDRYASAHGGDRGGRGRDARGDRGRDARGDRGCGKLSGDRSGDRGRGGELDRRRSDDGPAEEEVLAEYEAILTAEEREVRCACVQHRPQALSTCL